MLTVFATARFFDQIAFLSSKHRKDFPGVEFVVCVGLDRDNGAPFLGVIDKMNEFVRDTSFAFAGEKILFIKEHYFNIKESIILDYDSGNFRLRKGSVEIGYMCLHVDKVGSVSADEDRHKAYDKVG
jgi:hypothetical protein